MSYIMTEEEVELLLEQLGFYSGIKPEDGFVPNKETAIKIAEAVWLPLYGNKIYDTQPFQADYEEGDNWLVSGTLPSNGIGEVPRIRISKKTGKILYVKYSS